MSLVSYRTHTNTRMLHSSYLLSNYRILRPLGKGSYGVVHMAIHLPTATRVAIKVFKNRSTSFFHSMPESHVLHRVRHPNIIGFKELFKQGCNIYLVMEYMELDLYSVISTHPPPDDTRIRSYCCQILRGLDHLHRSGYYHCDLKPENILVTGDVLKLADFGAARQISSLPVTDDYVGTLYYVAPEVLLGAGVYGPSVDMWALGLIIVEMYNGGHPLFQGTSGEDQLNRICMVLGLPEEDTWEEGLHLARAVNHQFMGTFGLGLSYWIPEASEDAISLVESLLSLDPQRRPTAAEALAHPFITSALVGVTNLPTEISS